MMFKQYDISSQTLTISLEGHIDSRNSAEIGRSITTQCAEQPHKALVIDARSLKYISSSGLRMLMKLSDDEKARDNDKMSIIEVSREVYEIFDITGFTKILSVKKAYRNVTIDGCQIIGKGAWGTVYRLDPDTIVKVYSGDDSISMIKREQEMAKKAFLKGIPTPISFDLVRVGADYGSVFELLNSKSFNDYLVDLVSGEKSWKEDNRIVLEKLLQLYVDCIKRVHKTEFEPGELKTSKSIFLEYLQELESVIPKELLSWLGKLLHGLPDDFHAVHGDLQMKNVMLSDNEPMLIDMETMCTGQPIFDLQALYVTYKQFAEDEPANTMTFLGISTDDCDYIWKRVMELYYGTEDWVSLGQIEDRIRVLAAIRFLHTLKSLDILKNSLGELRLKHTIEHLRELSERVDKLV